MRQYFFSNEDWFKRIDFSERKTIAGQMLDYVNDKMLETAKKYNDINQETVRQQTGELFKLKEFSDICKRVLDNISQLIEYETKDEKVRKYLLEIFHQRFQREYEDGSTEMSDTQYDEWLDMIKKVFEFVVERNNMERSIDVLKDAEINKRNAHFSDNLYHHYIELRETYYLSFVAMNCPPKYIKKILKLARQTAQSAYNYIIVCNNDKEDSKNKEEFQNTVDVSLKHLKELRNCEKIIDQFGPEEGSKKLKKIWGQEIPITEYAERYRKKE